MAIQGKLVKQRSEEGTGEELYQQIQAEKQRLIKAGTIKKGKPLTEIAEDEKAFDIPESWKWVSIGDICANIQYGTSQKSSKTGKMAVLRMGNIQNGKINYNNLVYSSYESDIKKDDYKVNSA
jgi:type I restriction enzyme S subunit